MSTYNAIVSAIVHFETYRNVDLLHQGLYYLRASLTSEDGTAVGFPLDIYSSPHVSKAKKNKIDYHNIMPAATDEFAFNTKVFTIRYCEEEVELNDICEFRVEIPVTPKYLNANYMLEVQLHFGELTKIGGVEKLSQYVQNIKGSIDFKMVASQKFIIRGIAKGLSQYVKVQNDGSYYGVCNMTLHTTIIDFRYRVVAADTALAMRKAKAEIKPAAKSGVQKTLGDFLFANADGTMPAQIRPVEADKIYTEYVNVLAKSHEKLKERFLEVQRRCLTEKQRRDNCILLMCQDLIFPGDEGEDEMFSLQEDLPADIDLLAGEGEESKQRDLLIKEEDDQPPLKTEHEDVSECNITNEVSQLENYKKLDFDLRKEEKKDRVFRPPEDAFAGFGTDMDEQTNSNIFVPSFKPNQRPTFKGTAMVEPRPKYSLKMSSQDPYKCAAKFAFNITLISGQIIELWQKYIELITMTPRFVTEMLHFDYLKCVTTQKWGQCVLRTVLYTKDFAEYNTDINVAEVHAHMAKQRRLSLPTSCLPVEELSTIKPEAWPIMFEQIYIKMAEKAPVPPAIASSIHADGQNANADKAGGIHLIVLVHGFQGNSYDMRTMKNNLSILHPEALFLCSSKNESKTEEDIQEMGTRLAQEVIDFAQEWCPGSTLGMISFVGHSLGGVIIRAALPYLAKFKDKMETLVTLSSPHLGYMYASNTIVDAGMWVLKRWKKSKCLEQLTMSDALDYKENFLYKLSQQEGLGWFKNVLLVSSYQDRYVPVESARIELMQKAIDDERKGALYIEITKNILSSIKAERLYRIDIDFVISEKNLDSFIGRTAHIQFLENDLFMKVFTHRYTDFFN